MVKLSNNVDGYLKIGDQWKWCKVLKKFTQPNSDEVKIWFTDGTWKRMARIPESRCNTATIPKAELYVHPCGINMAIKNPDYARFVSMTRILDFEELVDHVVVLSEKLEDKMEKLDSMKESMKNILEKIKSNSQDPVLIAHAEGVAQTFQ